MTYYQINLVYHNYSSVGSSADSLDEAKTRLAEFIAYYSGDPCNYDPKEFEFNIDQVCSECDGRGEIFIPNRRTPRIGKNKRCPVCKGKNSRVRLI